MENSSLLHFLSFTLSSSLLPYQDLVTASPRNESVLIFRRQALRSCFGGFDHCLTTVTSSSLPLAWPSLYLCSYFCSLSILSTLLSLRTCSINSNATIMNVQRKGIQSQIIGNPPQKKPYSEITITNKTFPSTKMFNKKTA